MTILLGLVVTATVPAAALSTPDPLTGPNADEPFGACNGRVAEPSAGSAEWFAREAQNYACAQERTVDTLATSATVGGIGSTPFGDPYRDPVKWNGQRFRYAATSIPDRVGAALPVEVFRPCAPGSCPGAPRGVTVARGPYPTVLIVHGGSGNKELHWWAAETLAEAGYMAISFDVAETSGGDHATDTQDMLAWMFSTSFPYRKDLQRTRVGIAGHSQGASTASLIGQIDSRIKAIVAWDNLTALRRDLWSDDLGVDPPAKIHYHAPALGIGADYYLADGPKTEQPEPAPSNTQGGRGRGPGPHPKDLGYQEVKAKGLDTALFVLRAGTHSDFTPSTIPPPASRLGEATATYFTLAWFDRYLKGLDDPALAQDAYRRLVGRTSFDASVDVHNIGSGQYVPGSGNQPYRIAGTSICDRMSFYYTSRYALRPPGSSRVVGSEQWRKDCYAGRTALTRGRTAGR
jgi:hypothetical protein